MDAEHAKILAEDYCPAPDWDLIDSFADPVLEQAEHQSLEWPAEPPESGFAETTILGGKYRARAHQ